MRNVPHYFIRQKDGPEQEVTKAMWVAFERAAGFQSTSTEPITAGFGTNDISGRIEYRQPDKTTDELIKTWLEDTSGQYDRAAMWAGEEDATQEDVDRFAEVSSNVMNSARQLIARLIKERQTSFTMAEIKDALGGLDAPREHWVPQAGIVLDETAERKQRR